MSYPKQGGTPNCGAFATAYYHWETSKEAKPDTSEVEKITKAVMFGEDKPTKGMDSYCDPVKIMKYLENNLKVPADKVKFFVGLPNNPVDYLLNMMLAGPEREIILAWESVGRVIRKPVPEPWEGYLLSLCYAHTRKDVPDEKSMPPEKLQEFKCVHYMLVHRTKTEARGMNSWDGGYGTPEQEALETLKTQKTAQEKAVQEVRQRIEAEEGVTARSDEEKAERLRQYNEELQEKLAALADTEEKLKAAETKLKSTTEQLGAVSDAITRLNQQLSAYADQCRDDLARAEAAAEKVLDKKLELEKQRRETLASIQEFTVLIQSGVRLKNVAETAVQTLQVAIRCIKQVVVALMTTAKFWRSMEDYCRSLSDSGLGKEIKELSEGLSLEERLEYYQDVDFMRTLLVYVCRWAALYYVCRDYQQRNEKVRKLVADNMQSAGSREEEWAMAGTLAQEMSESINRQVEASKKITMELAG